MEKYRTVIVGVAVLALFLGTGSGDARQHDIGEDGLERFRGAVHAYAALHRDVERGVPPLEISPDPRKIHQAVEAMAEAMRAARPAARAGDIFDNRTSNVLRARIRETLLARGHDSADILAAMIDEDEGPASQVRPVVNDRFPWAQGSFMPPCLLEVLPSLPDEIEYRFVHRDLVLVDIHADLVVDVLAGALPADDSREVHAGE